MFFNTCGTIEHVITNQDAQLFKAYDPIEDSDDEDADSHGNVGEEAGLDGSAHRGEKRKLLKRRKTQVVPLPQPEPSLQTFRHTGSSAHILFTDPPVLWHALSLPATQHAWLPTTAAIALSGLVHYLALHKAQQPALAATKAYMDYFLEVFNHNKALSK